jgi:hypothetical protein
VWLFFAYPPVGLVCEAPSAFPRPTTWPICKCAVKLKLSSLEDWNYKQAEELSLFLSIPYLVQINSLLFLSVSEKEFSVVLALASTC